MAKYINERESKNLFLLAIQFQEEKAQRQDILGILLPEFIREDVILGKSNFSRDQEEASILFCDVYEFDKIMDAEDYKIVSLLDNLYREFDELAYSYGLQKIETVGKTYMAAGGLKAVERNLSKKITQTHHYIRMLIMSQKMHEVAAKSQWGKGHQIKLKVGVHIGPITAGVIGYHKPQFSLIGDTVNTTSRLCSNCEPGKSLFSDIIFEKISPYLESDTDDIDWAYQIFQFEAKGKGTLTAYYIFDSYEQEITLSHQEPKNQQEYQSGNVVPKKRGDKKLHTRVFDLQAKLSESRGYEEEVSQQVQEDSEEDQSSEPSQNQQQKAISVTNKFENDEREDNNLSHQEKFSLKNFPEAEQILNQTPNDEPSKFNSENKIFKTEEQQINYSKKNSLEQEKIQITFKSPLKDSLHSDQIDKPTQDPQFMKTSQKENHFNNQQEASSSPLLHQHSTNIISKAPTRNNNRLKTIDPRKLEGLIRQRDESKSTSLKSGSYQVEDAGNIEDDSSTSGPTDEQEVDTLKYNWFLQCTRDSLDLFADFQNQFFTKHSKMFIFHLLLTILLNFLMMIFRIILVKNGVNWLFYTLDIFSQIVFLLLIIFYSKKLISIKSLRLLTLVSMICSTLSILGENYWQYNGVFRLMDMLQIQAIIVLFTVNISTQFIETIFFQAFTILIFQIIDTIKGTFYMSDLVMLLVLSIGFLFQKREGIIRNIDSYNTNRTNDYQRNSETRLLVHLLPTHIYHKFLRNPEDNSIFTQKFSQTTLLFADISGFTAFSSNKKPEEVVKMLKSLFIKFDHNCMKHNVFKLYTIGDCYIVLGFSDANRRNPPVEAKNVIEMGFSMIESIRAFRKEHKDPSDQSADIDMRIGIHIGDIIGGVIGKNVVRYDIYGKDVLLANKMESNGERGRILISEPLKNMVSQHFPEKFEYKSGPEVEVKSINIKMKSFFIGKRSE